MKIFPLLILLSSICMAQGNLKVMEPINLIFDGMKKGDSAMVHRAFHPSAKLFSVLVDPNTH